MNIARILLTVALVALAACESDGVVRPPPTDVRFFHAAPNFGTLAILREARPEAVLEFGGGASARFDSGEYDFHVESREAGTLNAIRELTLTENLSSELDYSFVAVAPGGNPQILLVDTPPFDPTSSMARLSFIAAHPDLGPVDVYLQAAGTSLPAVVANGSVSYGETELSFTVPIQPLHIFLTPAGDPNTILYESIELNFNAGSSNVLVIHGTGAQLASDIAVSITGSTALRIAQLGVDSVVRVAQGSDDRLARDVLVDDDTTPLFPAQAFGVLSDYMPVSPGTRTLSLTPVGAPGTVETSFDFPALSGRSYIAAFAGNTTEGITGRAFLEDPRRIVRQASISFLNIAGLFNNVYIYVRPPGTAINTVFPSLELASAAFAARSFQPGNYEVTIQDSITAAILAGPIPVSFADSGVYGMLLRNGADSLTVEIDYFYDTP